MFLEVSKNGTYFRMSLWYELLRQTDNQTDRQKNKNKNKAQPPPLPTHAYLPPTPFPGFIAKKSSSQETSIPRHVSTDRPCSSSA